MHNRIQFSVNCFLFFGREGHFHSRNGRLTERWHFSQMGRYRYCKFPPLLELGLYGDSGGLSSSLLTSPQPHFHSPTLESETAIVSYITLNRCVGGGGRANVTTVSPPVRLCGLLLFVVMELYGSGECSELPQVRSSGEVIGC